MTRSTLSCVGKAWALLSLLTAAVLCVGFYMPYWLSGRMAQDGSVVNVGLFRRCTYPEIDRSQQTLIIKHECGRYTTFHDIPSVAWQIASVVVGVGCGAALVVAFITTFALCISDVFGKIGARIAGSSQLLAGLLVGAGCAVYPYGWSSRQVKDFCGENASEYSLGDCEMSWAFYATAATALLLFICFFMSLRATRGKSIIYNV